MSDKPTEFQQSLLERIRLNGRISYRGTNAHETKSLRELERKGFVVFVGEKWDGWWEMEEGKK